MFVLTLPLAAGQEGLALFSFIGGFSSATSMIIVESIALSIMVSNHIVMPLVLRFTQGRGHSARAGRQPPAAQLAPLLDRPDPGSRLPLLLS